MPEPRWEQIGGDVNAERYGALLARYGPPEHDWVDVVEIQNLEDSLSDDELVEFGAGFMIGIASFDADELDEQFEWALKESGLEAHLGAVERLRRADIRERRLFTAQTIIGYSGIENAEGYDGTFGEAVSRITGEDPQEVAWWAERIDLSYDPLAGIRGEGPPSEPEPEPVRHRARPSVLARVRVEPYYRWRS